MPQMSGLFPRLIEIDVDGTVSICYCVSKEGDTMACKSKSICMTMENNRLGKQGKRAGARHMTTEDRMFGNPSDANMYKFTES